MADDVIPVMDTAALARADLMGYSMGGRIAISLLARFPDRLSRVRSSANIGDGTKAGTAPEHSGPASRMLITVRLTPMNCTYSRPVGSHFERRVVTSWIVRRDGRCAALAACDGTGPSGTLPKYARTRADACLTMLRP